VHTEPHAPQLTAISWGGQFYGSSWFLVKH
jgi:hypothetical protein